MRVAMLVAIGTLFAGAAEWDSYTCVVRSGPRPVEGLEVSGFEDATEYGPWKWGKRPAEVGRFGYNGGGGVKYRPGNVTATFTFPFDGKLVTGRTYALSCLVKTSGKIFSNLIWSRNRNGKYLRESGGGTKAEIGGGWFRHVITFTPPEMDGTDGITDSVGLWVRPDEKDESKLREDNFCVFIDDVRLEESCPAWAFNNVWPIQNRVYSETGRVRCKNWFVGDFFGKGAQPFFVVELLGDNGVADTQLAHPDTDDVFTVAFGKLDWSGPAKLVARLYDRRNRLAYGARTNDVVVTRTPVPAAGRPFIAENGVTYVDGKPFMPLGFWTGIAGAYADAGATPEAEAKMRHGLRELSDAGFNTIVEYGGYRLTTEAMRKAFYGACGDSGIHVMAGELGAANWNPKDPEMPAKYRARAKFYDRMPNVLGWCMMDEAPMDWVDRLVKMRRILSEESPDRPTWPCNIFEPEPYLPGEDVIGGDLYPIWNADSSLARSDEYLQRVERCRGAAWWNSPQCYNWKGKKVNWKNKDGITAEEYLAGEPTENQMLAVALLMASRGVTGFFFYSHFDLWRNVANVPNLPETRWERMKAIARTMNSIAPFIQSGLPRETVTHRDLSGACRVVALRDGKGRERLLVIGMDSGENACEIDLTPFTGLDGRSLCGKTAISDGKAVYRACAAACDVIE